MALSMETQLQSIFEDVVVTRIFIHLFVDQPTLVSLSVNASF